MNICDNFLNVAFRDVQCGYKAEYRDGKLVKLKRQYRYLHNSDKTQTVNV